MHTTYMYMYMHMTLYIWVKVHVVVHCVCMHVSVGVHMYVCVFAINRSSIMYMHPQVSKLYEVIRKMRGLDYPTQHELCKELDEKDEEFIDALKVRAIIFSC